MKSKVVKRISEKVLARTNYSCQISSQLSAIFNYAIPFYTFEMLYLCGIREGELLALTPADFDFEWSTVSINKSYQRINKQDVITTPKTKKRNRVIQMPNCLC